MTAADVAVAEGYTVPERGRPLRSRVRGLRFVIVIALACLAILVLTIAGAESTSSADLSTKNPGDYGAMAAAEILRDQGVGIQEVEYLSRIHVADPATTTLAVTLPSNLSGLQLASVFAYPGDLVFVGAGEDLVDALTDGLEYDPFWGDPQYAHCADPDAAAAGRTTAAGPRIRATTASDAVVCFADSEGYGTYLRLERDGRLILVVTDPLIAMNENLADEGNAALVLRTLGKNDNLVWYVGALDDTTSYVQSGAPGSGAPGQKPPDGVETKPGFLPSGSGEAVFALVAAAAAAAIWRGRRMGPLVTESLPVVVHASESARGRGRLYQRARAYGRAAAALRAAAAERMGKRLGVPRSADAPALVAAISRVSRRDSRGIERLLYGPPPTDEPGMMALVHELDTLEREVQRP